MGAIDSVAPNYLLFLNFQFNDDYFRKIFCACLRFQSCCLGREYAKDMQMYFVKNNAIKPTYRQTKAADETTINTSEHQLKKIDEEEESNENVNDSVEIKFQNSVRLGGH